MSLSFAAVEVPRVRLARDIKVDGRKAPNPSRDGVPSGPGAHTCHGVSQRSLTVAALIGATTGRPLGREGLPNGSRSRR